MEEKDIKDYLNDLFPRFVKIMSLPEEQCSYDLRNQTIDALGTTVTAGKAANVMPYFQGIFDALHNTFFSSNSSLVELKGVCLSSFGKVAVACCEENPQLYKEKFNPLKHKVT